MWKFYLFQIVNLSLRRNYQGTLDPFLGRALGRQNDSHAQLN